MWFVEAKWAKRKINNDRRLEINNQRAQIGNRRFAIDHRSIMEGLKSRIGGKEISWFFGKPEKCDSVKAKQAFCYRLIWSDVRFAINCQGKMTLEQILKAPMCVCYINLYIRRRFWKCCKNVRGSTKMKLSKHEFQ